ncbi:lytic transglycosylase domain-containing protein [Rhodovulum kholense]|uniref:Soluble lytic murein transglycosylase-like protein n=1 Tax=Rhodovulum kholense TaxID=453584 RepID=A0A8E2VKY4_9RHOB|nr:lytic transglycosylase domain-containing protein [Rhodovulum kholense]PTW50787.1 soluble lytic murein transglycosylase-like protein [Rhodovulum kholense]
MRRHLEGLVLAGLVLASAGAAPGPVRAEPPPWPEFTFRRVKPPAPGASRRITVQIEPRATVVPAALGPPTAPLARAPDAAAEPPPGNAAQPGPAWFWSRVSPALSDSRPGRLAPALEALGEAPPGEAVRAPRLQLLQDIAEAHGRAILSATVGTRVSPALALAVIGVESGGRGRALSPKGALGLMQLIPATARRFGVADAADPVANIRGGVAYLDWLMGEFGGDPVLVLAAYNAGEGAVRAHGGVPPYLETRDYVPKVLAAWAVARGLCRTPPELISDGCVFRAKGRG